MEPTKFTIWVEYRGERFASRDKIEKLVGCKSHGGGGALGECGGDCSWHNLSKDEAKKLKKKLDAIPPGLVNSVRCIPE